MNEDRLPLRWAILCWLLMAAAGWAVLGCAATKLMVQPPSVFSSAQEVTAERAFSPGLWNELRALVSDEDPRTGFVRQIFPETACYSSIALPYVIPANRPPRVGEEWECLFVTCVSSMPPEPDWFAWLVVSTREPDPLLPIDLGSIGLHGCKLLVNLDSIISVPPGFEAPSGSLLTRVPGRGEIHLRWTPAPGMAGHKLWMQLLVHAPGYSPGGFLLSYAVELAIGSQ